jgi:type IX secretion system substrate protein/galactose oxidase-like protein
MHRWIRNLFLFATLLFTQSTLLFIQSATAAPLSKWGELKVPPGSPIPDGRTNAAAIYDPIRNVLVVVGGVANGPDGNPDWKQDVWTLSFGKKSQWTEHITNGGPGPRVLASTVYDGTRDRMVFFGGVAPDGVQQNDVWALSLSDFTWTAVITDGTPPFRRQGHSAIYDEARDRMIVFGGMHDFDSQSGDLLLFFKDVWALQFGTTNTWQEIHPSNEGPGERRFHTAALVASSDWMVVTGGYGVPGINNVPVTSNSVWALSLGSSPEWINLYPENDAADAPHGLLNVGGFDPSRNRIVSFQEAYPVSNEVWGFSLDAQQWVNLSPQNAGPSLRSGASGVLDPTLDRMLIFGGGDGVEQFNDTWAIKWIDPKSPGRAHLSLQRDLPAPNVLSLQVSPNPFKAATRIQYALSVQEWVDLSVYDLQGRKVASLQAGTQDAGEYVVSWRDAESSGSGIYFVKLTTKSGSQTQQVLRLQ